MGVSLQCIALLNDYLCKGWRWGEQTLDRDHDNFQHQDVSNLVSLQSQVQPADRDPGQNVLTIYCHLNHPPTGIQQQPRQMPWSDQHSSSPSCPDERMNLLWKENSPEVETLIV